MTGYQSKRAAARDKLDDDDIQVYKRPWVDLTDDEILKFQDIVPNTLSYDLIEFARAVLAKSKEKNS